MLWPRRVITHSLVVLLVSATGCALGVSDARSCSTFALKDEAVLLVGHNLDETPGFEVPGLLCINKRGVYKRGLTWADLIAPPEAGGWQKADPLGPPDSRISWVSKHGSVTFNADGLEFPDCGINEAGLVVCEMSLPITRFPVDEANPSLFMSLWVQYVLDNCSSVAEVIDSAHKTNLDGWNWHFFAADASGASLVVEFIDGMVLTYTAEKLPVPVLCNSSYAFELERLRERQGPGVKQAIKRLFSRAPRFVRAARMLEAYGAGNEASSFDYGWKILKEIRIPDWNKWSILFDVPNRCVYFNTEGNRGIRSLSLEGIDFTCKTPGKVLDVHSSSPGDVAANFVDYSYERNFEFLRKRAVLLFEERLRPLTENGLTPQLYARRFARYPENTSCRGQK